MSVNVYGYVRVSTRDQNLDRQLTAMDEFGVQPDKVFADKASGKDFERPEYLKLKAILRKGDVVVVKSIDRLGRNYVEILDEWRIITKEKHASIVVLDMPLLDTREKKEGITNVLISDIVLQLLSYVAEVERDNIKQRQAEGIAAAKARGVKFGRPCIKRPDNYLAVKNEYLAGRENKKTAATKLGVSRTTFERWLAADTREEERRDGK